MSIIFQLFSAEDLKKLNAGDLNDLRDQVLTELGRSKSFKKDSDGGRRDELKSTISSLTSITAMINNIDAQIDAQRLKNNAEQYSAIEVNNTLEKLKEVVTDIQKTLDNLTGRLPLNLTEKMAFDKNHRLTNENLAKIALRKRFNEVVNQLDAIPEDFNYKKLISGEYYKEHYKEDSAKELILRWAISCELNHIEFYDHLFKAKEAADKFFGARMLAKTNRTINQLNDQEKMKLKPSKPSDSIYSPYNPRHPLYRQYYNALKSAPETPKTESSTDSSKTSGT